jgi:hypothetical protein
MNLEKQKKNVDILLQLIAENPGLPIVPMVATDCVSDDSFSCWMAEWGEARVDKYWVADERIYSYIQDIDELQEDWVDNNYEDYPEGTEYETLIGIAKKEIDGYDWVDAIIIYINSL